jgi:beta-glucosidase
LTATISIQAARRRPPLTTDSTLQEWKDDPIAGPELVRAVGVTDDGVPVGILGDEELTKVIGNFPLRTLVAFTGLGITEDVVSQLTARFVTSRLD